MYILRLSLDDVETTKRSLGEMIGTCFLILTVFVFTLPEVYMDILKPKQTCVVTRLGTNGENPHVNCRVIRKIVRLVVP